MKNRLVPGALRIILILGLLSVVWSGDSQAKSFYEGQTIRLIVATSPGGGYDAFGRLLAAHLGKYLPGCTVIVDNLPGAGHIIGCNTIYAAKPDGLTFGIFNKGLITMQLVGMEGVRFDLSRMSWLGTPSVEPRVFVLSDKAPFRKLDDLKNNPAQTCLLSSAGLGSAANTDALIVLRILGLTNVKVVPGYKGTEGELAMMRGEIHGQIGTMDSMMPLVERGEAHPILVIDRRRLKAFPDVPTLHEVTPPEYQDLVELMMSQILLGRPFAGPPDIPEDRLNILREAFEKTWRDPEVMKQAEKMGRPIDFVNAEETEAAVKNALNQPPEVMEFLKATFKPEE
jgi:tripartite-type tricarboxylate transporter receptor subunit TctC